MNPKKIWNKNHKQQQTDSSILSLNEIYELKNINGEVVKEALKEAEKRQDDLDKTKNANIRKASLFLGSFIPLSVTLTGISFAIFQSNKFNHWILFWFSGTAFLFAVAAIAFAYALMPMDFGTLGSSPSVWLRKEVLCANESGFNKQLAYTLHHYHARIVPSYKSCQKQSTRITCGIWLGVFAATFFWVGILFTFFS